MNEEKILVSLGYNVSDATMAQVRGILSKCDFDENQIEKILMLNDKIKIYDGYVNMSNSHDYFKIKNDSEDEDKQEVVRQTIKSWEEKYKFVVEKLPNKETYYIKGRI